jgi:hypothetical protein
MTRARGRVLPLVRGADDPRGLVVTVIGPPDSGKSLHLWNVYTRHAPRIITLEVVEETAKRETGARALRRTFGYQDTAAALADVATLATWHVVAWLDRDETERLFRVLCPELLSAQTRSYARAVGGLVVACGELAHAAPLGLGKGSAVRNAYLRYRHHWLSLHGATQHAPLCDPVSRLGADRCVFFNTPDDLARDAIARASSRDLARRVEELPQYHTLTIVKSLRRAYVADDRARVYEVLDYRARLVAARDIAGALAGSAASVLDQPPNSLQCAAGGAADAL